MVSDATGQGIRGHLNPRAGDHGLPFFRFAAPGCGPEPPRLVAGTCLGGPPPDLSRRRQVPGPAGWPVASSPDLDTTPGPPELRCRSTSPNLDRQEQL